jgi:hypothetical protein
MVTLGGQFRAGEQVRNHVRGCHRRDLRRGADWPRINSFCLHYQIRVFPFLAISNGAVFSRVAGAMRLFSVDFPASVAVCKLVGCKHKTKRLPHRTSGLQFGTCNTCYPQVDCKFAPNNLPGSRSSHTPQVAGGPATSYATSTRVGLRGLFSVAHNRMCSVLRGFGDRDRMAGVFSRVPKI